MLKVSWKSSLFLMTSMALLITLNCMSFDCCRRVPAVVSSFRTSTASAMTVRGLLMSWQVQVVVEKRSANLECCCADQFWLAVVSQEAAILK